MLASHVLGRSSASLRRLTRRIPLATLSSSSKKPEKDPIAGRNAFQSMPGQGASLPGLLLLLGLVWGFNAFSDWYDPRPETLETLEEEAARQMQVQPFEVAKVMDDGRVLMRDGSIRVTRAPIVK